MEDIPYIDPQLDQFIERGKTDKSALSDIFCRFSILSGKGSKAFISHYSQIIQDVFKHWENVFPEAKGMALLCHGLSKFYLNEYAEVPESMEKAVPILEGSSYEEFLGIGYLYNGTNCRSIGQLDKAVEYLMKGVELVNENGPLALFKAYCYYQLGEISLFIHDFKHGGIYYHKALEITKKVNAIDGLFRLYNGLANYYLSQNDYGRCKEYLDLSLNAPNLSKSQKSRSLCDLGIYYLKLNDPDNAEKNLLLSYQYRKENNLLDAAATSLIGLGETWLIMSKYKEAEAALTEALDYCTRFNSVNKIMQCHKWFAELYRATKDFEKAAEHYHIYDDLRNEQHSRQLQNIYKFNNDKIEKQKQIIESIHEEVKDSIRYAKRIQSAILPSDSFLSSLLKDVFVLYKPKDIVAGDFYWIQEQGNKLHFAVADCTGHGVPGAMVSVVCNNALNRSIKEFGEHVPGKILDKTRDIVIEEFGKSDDEVKDGMDISLVSMIKDQGTSKIQLQWSGANNPLWIIRKGCSEILEYKAQKQPIGQFDTAIPFTTQEIEMFPGDQLYLLSDGYQDQFGGPENKKFKASRLKELLIRIAPLSLPEQREMLDDQFKKWKGNLEQIDDVCIIGVRF